MAKRKYIINDPEGLNLKFYQKYDEDFLYRKADTLLFIAEEHEKFRSFVQENDGDVEGIDSKFVETLRAEVHFTEFHQFEAFFALLIAIFQDLPHWLYLTTYPPGEIKKKVRLFLDEDIKTLTNGKLNSLEDFLNHAIYAGFVSNKQKIADNWQTNLDNIAWLLRRMSQKYLDGTEYNAYKG